MKYRLPIGTPVRRMRRGSSVWSPALVTSKAVTYDAEDIADIENEREGNETFKFYIFQLPAGSEWSHIQVAFSKIELIKEGARNVTLTPVKKSVRYTSKKKP